MVLGNSASRWGCSRIGYFSPVVLVTQAAPRQGYEHQRQRLRSNREVQIAAEHARGEKELDQGRTVKSVPGSVYQNGHEYAAPRVVEDPHNDETETDESEGKHDEVEDGTPRRYIRNVLGWDQEPGQVPQGPEASQDEA